MNQIEHVVVLMLENRSFDHMLGFLYPGHPTYKGLTGSESNTDKNNTTIFVNKDATGQIPYDPHHRHEHVCIQLTKAGPPLTPANIAMNGFAFDAATPSTAVMSCFDPIRLPVLSTLAREYTVCDQWFSSVPGQTWPNRNFVHAGHSDRRVNNRPYKLYRMPTIFERLDEARVSWRIYHDRLPQVAVFPKLWLGSLKRHFYGMRAFARHAADGHLAAYSFIEPKHMFRKTNSQHPSDNKKNNRDCLAGEELIRRVYEALLNGPKWDKTLLVITYDEHGGFFDHERPITVASPHPGETDKKFNFDFTLTGVRVPTVIVSPWVRRGHVDSTPYDHTSIPRSVRKRFADGTDPLSDRESSAQTWWDLLGPLRNDKPKLPPRVRNRISVFVTSLLDRTDPHSERPEEDDDDMNWLARRVDELLNAEERGADDQLAARLEELERGETEEVEGVLSRSKGEVGRYVERVGRRFEQAAEIERGRPQPMPRLAT